MPLMDSSIDPRAFVASLDGYFDNDQWAYWVHMDHKPIMVAAGFQPVTVPDDIHGGRRQAMGGIGHYWNYPHTERNA